jgi:hypothetical protein
VFLEQLDAPIAVRPQPAAVPQCVQKPSLAASAAEHREQTGLPGGVGEAVGTWPFIEEPHLAQYLSAGPPSAPQLGHVQPDWRKRRNRDAKGAIPATTESTTFSEPVE